MIKAVSIAAALAFATPALAVPLPQATPPAAEAKSPEEIAFEARAEAFEAQMTQMQSEVETAIRSAGGDEAAGMARIDAILARYQPEIASFLDDFDRFIDTQATAETDDTTRQALAGAQTGVRQALEALPGQIRAGARTAITAQPPAA